MSGIPIELRFRFQPGVAVYPRTLYLDNTGMSEVQVEYPSSVHSIRVRPESGGQPVSNPDDVLISTAEDAGREFATVFVRLQSESLADLTTTHLIIEGLSEDSQVVGSASIGIRAALRTNIWMEKDVFIGNESTIAVATNICTASEAVSSVRLDPGLPVRDLQFNANAQRLSFKCDRSKGKQSVQIPFMFRTRSGSEYIDVCNVYFTDVN